MEPTPSAEPGQPPRPGPPATSGPPPTSGPPATPTHGVPVPVQRQPGGGSSDATPKVYPVHVPTGRAAAPVPHPAAPPAQPGYPAVHDDEQDGQWQQGPRGPRQNVEGWPDGTPDERPDGEPWPLAGAVDGAPGADAKVLPLGSRRAPAPDATGRPDAPASPSPVEPPPDVRTWQPSAERSRADNARRGALSAFPRYGILPPPIAASGLPPAPVRHTGPEVVRWGHEATDPGGYAPHGARVIEHGDDPSGPPPAESGPDLRLAEYRPGAQDAEHDRTGYPPAEFDASTPTPPEHDPDQQAPDQHGSDRHGPDQHGSDRHGPDQHGPDQHGPDQHGPDQHGPDQHGPDQHDGEPQGSERYEAEPHHIDQDGFERRGSEYAGGRYGPDGYETGHPQQTARYADDATAAGATGYDPAWDGHLDYEDAQPVPAEADPRFYPSGLIDAYEARTAGGDPHQPTEARHDPADQTPSGPQPVEHDPAEHDPAEHDLAGYAQGGGDRSAGAEDGHRGKRRSADDPAQQQGDQTHDAETGAAAGQPAQRLRPGDVAQSALAVWTEPAAQRFRDDWHEVKALFVDEPVEALAQAGALVTAAVNEVTAALLSEQERLDPLRQAATPDTETMRIALRRYREFLDRILEL